MKKKRKRKKTKNQQPKNSKTLLLDLSNFFAVNIFNFGSAIFFSIMKLFTYEKRIAECHFGLFLR